MTERQRVQGQRFTQIYLEPSETVTDSIRLRNRVGEYFYSALYRYGEAVKGAILSELGCPMKSTGYAGVDVRTFLKQCELHDFLDALTVIAAALPSYEQSGRSYPRPAWIAFVNRAMRETNVSFELDDEGGVHPRVDAAFVANRQTAVAGLGRPKYQAALEHFEDAYSALDGGSPATGRAIREMHLAIEAVFKQAYPKASRIDVGEINSHLKAAVACRLDGPELEAAKLMLTSAGNFVSASHQYRHAAGQPEPTPPSMETAIWMLSQGTAFLRWLISFLETDEIEH